MGLIFANVGWMESYRGLTDKDPITGGGSWVKAKGSGHEVCNFLPYKGFVYGYVQPVNDGRINIERIASVEDDKVSPVTVVWTATRPEGGRVVVGWYLNATVYRDFQSFKTVPIRHKKSGVRGYRIKARAEDAVLLPVDSRTCSIPQGVKGGGAMGTSNVWYADKPADESTVKRVQALINGKPQPGKKRSKKRTQDTERKSLVEKSAVHVVSAHYEALGYQIASVESDNVGWDLEARHKKTILRIEVKGLSQAEPRIGLTPNEYAAFLSGSSDYRLAIVTKALSEYSLFICRYSAEEARWVIEGNARASIGIETRESANIYINS